MERLVTVKDMAERYGCSMKTARTYLRRMFHYENPLTAPKWALDEWEKSRERMPQGSTPSQRIEIERRKSKQGRIIVPRKREG
jgi:hypothetical protein